MGLVAQLEALLESVTRLMGVIDGKLRNKADRNDVYTKTDIDDPNRTLGANAATAHRWKVPRLLTFIGDAGGQVGIDGSENITVTVSVPALADKASKSEAVTPAQMDARFKELVGVAPDFLDQFSEIAAAIGNDPNFAASMTKALAAKSDKATAYTSVQIDDKFLLKTARAADSILLGGNTSYYYASADSVAVLDSSVADAFQSLAAAFNAGAEKINNI